MNIISGQTVESRDKTPSKKGPDQIQLGVINVSEDARGRMGESRHCLDQFPLNVAFSF